MIGLDTNVVVRYIAQDDARQSAAATRLIEQRLSVENPGLVSLIVLCEIAWVLADCYRAGKQQVRDVIEGLLASKQIVVEEADLVWKALRSWKDSRADFSDALIGQVLLARGCERIVTFDKAAEKLPGFEAL